MRMMSQSNKIRKLPKMNDDYEHVIESLFN